MENIKNQIEMAFSVLHKNHSCSIQRNIFVLLWLSDISVRCQHSLYRMEKDIVPPGMGQNLEQFLEHLTKQSV